MKLTNSQLAFLAAILTALLGAAFSAPGRADGTASRALARGSLHAKLQYCEDCHGPSGQGYRGYFPIPRLAGQTPEYIQNQLRAFAERRRENNIAIVMSRVHGLTPELQAALATQFSAFNPKPFGRVARPLGHTGQEIYGEGLPDANVPACAACHGPEAKGIGPVPGLAGQLYPYLVKELANWGTERGQNPAVPDTSAIMRPIAHSLTKAQIEAVAAYLSDLE